MKGKIKKRVLKLTALFVAVLVLYMANSQLLIRTGMSAESHIRNFYREPKNTIDAAIQAIICALTVPWDFTTARCSKNLCQGRTHSLWS